MVEAASQFAATKGSRWLHSHTVMILEGESIQHSRIDFNVKFVKL